MWVPYAALSGIAMPTKYQQISADTSITLLTKYQQASFLEPFNLRSRSCVSSTGGGRLLSKDRNIEKTQQEAPKDVAFYVS